jgi:hypothetical protein
MAGATIMPAAGMVFAPTVLMLLSGDSIGNIAITGFSYREGTYLTLLRGEHP